ncbi:MAG TPA: copper resistance protein CopC [Dehalococcoidia bacterium]|nr:copper resistance protein CopC [Dehalococcoidia bacterium]
MRKIGAAALAAAIAVIAIVLGFGVAGAHSRPVRLEPAPGAVLQSAPAQVQGWFTADLRRDPNWTFIRVTDAQGNRVDTGETVLSANRRQMTATLRSGLGPGRYLVTWRTWDEVDGAIFGDCYYFFVGQAAADQALAENLRLDGGRACERIDVSARGGTPVPGLTPTVAATAAAADGHDEPAEDDGEDGDGGVPVWGLALGIAGGVVVGAVGARVLGRS